MLKSIRNSILILFIFLLSFGTVFVKASETNDSSKIFFVATHNYDYIYKLLDLVNEERAKVGANPLVMDEDLLNAALQRSAEISLYGNHIRPDGSMCNTVSDKLFGENIAKGQITPERVMKSWMGSPGHRSNILNKDFTTIGIGHIIVSGKTSWVQCFGIEEPKEVVRRSDTIEKYYTIEILNKYIIDIRFVNKAPIELKVGGKGDKGLWYDMGIGYLIIDGKNAKWSSSNTNIATVDQTGMVTGVSCGETTINATIGDKTASIRVIVSYDDVNEDDWYYNSVIYCATNKIIYGTSNTTFSPNKNLTRANLVTNLWRMEGNPTVSDKQKFSDVKEGQYYYEAVKWAESKGIVNGYEDGKFRPNNNITREQLATILMNYAKFKGKDTNEKAELSKYKDQSGISSYARDGVSWAIAKNVMSGKAEGTVIDPRGTAIRAEVAAMIENYCNYVGR